MRYLPIILLFPLILTAQTHKKVTVHKKLPKAIEIMTVGLDFNSIGTPMAVIKYKNVSGKNIDAVEFNIRCYNNFNEPVVVDGDNIYPAISQDYFLAGDSQEHEWTLFEYENARKFKVSVTRVHFDTEK